MVALVVGLTAPYQCSGEPDFEDRRAETPGEALFGLAEQFKAQGEDRAYRDTLEYLVARYPNSRFAKMAKADLSAAGGASGK